MDIHGDRTGTQLARKIRAKLAGLIVAEPEAVSGRGGDPLDRATISDGSDVGAILMPGRGQPTPVRAGWQLQLDYQSASHAYSWLGFNGRYVRA
jgi:hypothetical protein